MDSFLKITILCILFACTIESKGQFYLGLSANLGNKLKYTPESPGLGTPPAISGSIVGIYNEELRNNWALQYGVAFGVLGYILKIKQLDTLTVYEDPPSRFFEYSMLYGKFHLVLGKTVPVGKKQLMIGIGGGVSYYYSIFPETSYSIGQLMDDGSLETLFVAEFDSPQKSILPFVKISSQLKLNERFTIGLEYAQSFKSIVNGTYQFDHTSVPSSGGVSLYPGELGLVFLISTHRQMNTE